MKPTVQGKCSVGKQARASRDEQLRDLVVIEVLPDRSIGRGAQRVEGARDLLLLDETPDLLDGLGRAVAVVQTDQVDLRPLTPPCSLIILK